MTAFFRESDANLNALKGRRIAVFGYGNLGCPVALNMRDSGLPVIVGNVSDRYADKAQADGFDVMGLTEAARLSDIKLLLLPDEVMPEEYLKFISPSLKQGDTLVFASGYNIAFGFIEPPPFVDVVMIAPRTIGAGVREMYLSGQGFLSFIAVAQDATGKAWDQLLALALAIGALRSGALEITFRQEAEIDLFIQQALLPALHNLMYAAADLLIKEGYPPEAALLDLYVSGELGYSLTKAAEMGLMDTLRLSSLTSQYGLLSRAVRFQDPKLTRQMELTLEEIRSGKFAQEWAADYANGYPRLEALRSKHSKMMLWVLEQQAIALLRGTHDE
ncbi:MAG TPA: ketol-acid reductoisomerase [Aggregatilineaceae bacterium]|nr:ketol-acid reductoisomerase [Aggregatilineaceae bacterium]